jgi:hypothetical protein
MIFYVVELPNARVMQNLMLAQSGYFRHIIFRCPYDHDFFMLLVIADRHTLFIRREMMARDHTQNNNPVLLIKNRLLAVFTECINKFEEKRSPILTNYQLSHFYTVLFLNIIFTLKAFFSITLLSFS